MAVLLKTGGTSLIGTQKTAYGGYYGHPKAIRHQGRN